MMNMKKVLDEEEFKDFVGDFNKHFEDPAKWREYFWRNYPEIFYDSPENEVQMDTTMETESRPIVDREEKLRKVEEKLLSNKTLERFTNYDGVMSDDNLSLPQKSN